MTKTVSVTLDRQLVYYFQLTRLAPFDRKYKIQANLAQEPALVSKPPKALHKAHWTKDPAHPTASLLTAHRTWWTMPGHGVFSLVFQTIRPRNPAHPAAQLLSSTPHLVDDAGARLPEADAVLGPRRGQEVIDLLVHVLGKLQVGLATILALPAQRVCLVCVCAQCV